MRAKTTAELLVDLGVAASFARPRVSNDNPFSEAQFKTLKYYPSFPEDFAGVQHARTFLRPWFTWYNEEHLHSGIGFMTPAAVHFHRAAGLQEQRAQVLQAAFAAKPGAIQASRAYATRIVHRRRHQPSEIPHQNSGDLA